MDLRQVDLLTQFCKICTKNMDFSWLWLLRIVNYINAKRHEKFCRCSIGRIDATPVFSQTVLMILIHPLNYTQIQMHIKLITIVAWNNKFRRIMGCFWQLWIVRNIVCKIIKQFNSMAWIFPLIRIVIMWLFDNVQNTPLNCIYTTIVRETINRCPIERRFKIF